MQGLRLIVLCGLALAWPARLWAATPSEEPTPTHELADDPRAPDDAELAYRSLSELLAQGKDREAAGAAFALADRYPKSRYAADTLFTAAKLYEERLRDPAQAIVAYQRIANEYPNSRVALASERRLRALRQSLDNDGSAAALARWNQIRYEFASRPMSRSLEMAEALVTDNPSWPGRAEVYLWLGDIHLGQRRSEDARRAFSAAAESAGNSRQRYEAQRGLGSTYLQDGNYSAAKSAFEKLEVDDDTGRAEDRAEALRSVGTAELRDRAYLASLAWLVAVALAFLLALVRRSGLRSSIHSVGHPPFEAVYLIPVVILLALISLTGHPDIGPAVVIIGIAGISFTWLLGALLRDAPPKRRFVGWLWAAASVSAVLASIYVALHRTRLIDLVVATVRFGPDH